MLYNTTIPFILKNGHKKLHCFTMVQVTKKERRQESQTSVTNLATLFPGLTTFQTSLRTLIIKSDSRQN